MLRFPEPGSSSPQENTAAYPSAPRASTSLSSAPLKVWVTLWPTVYVRVTSWLGMA
ncbi:hypothetical protein HNQ07_002045 [Deinococcus metalli]|uniref:Uncharacterized protein n=1 Tax=Deinococcus metalli TaxID=1141878 RepID=A0A7W8NPA2_9DEIO|nr:hypothetical protein [Deinococcus metalli]MBB5376581.1 hypothetical protein [Deinococcus metalli]